MRKIKKFRIPIYTYDILRKAKKRRIDLFALGLAAQEDAKEYVSSLAASLEPSTVFDRLAPEDELAVRAGMAKSAYATLGVVTLGQAFESKLGSVTDPELFRLAETAAAVFADTGLKIVSELVAQEITSEGLSSGDLSRLLSFHRGTEDGEQSQASDVAADAGLASACLARLNADKIGVAMNGGAFAPKYTVLFAIPWLAPKKKKPAAGTRT